MREKRAAEPRFPVSTYRLQFNRQFTFAAARKLVDYLHGLGIMDVYASPIFKARPESLHGYEIIDPGALNPELGTAAEFEEFAEELARRGLGLLLDIVPNHMCITCAENAWWSDVLENGQSSPYAPFFDIDWHPPRQALENKVLIPILGDQYGNVLENQELNLVFEDGAFVVTYYGNRLPLSPDTYPVILTHRLGELEGRLASDSPDLTELRSIVTALGHLPSREESDPTRVDERQREKEVIKRRLAGLIQTSAVCRAFIEENVRFFNGRKGEPASFDLLDELMGRQVWRLSSWRLATEEINYRRFFDINDLAAIRMEYPPAFEKAHTLVFSLVREGKITGLRVDHVDGLFDPADYLGRLQESCRPAAQAAAQDETGGLLKAEPETSDKTFYVVGEKILTPGESLPGDWPVHGTTGYDFMGAANSLFVEMRNARIFDEIYRRFARERLDFQELVYKKKKLVIQTGMSAEINRLARRLNKIAEKSRHTRDFTVNSLVRAVTEIMACFPVYRTYTRSPEVRDAERRHVEAAALTAKRKNPALSALIFDFLRDVLLLRFPEDFSRADQSEWLEFVMKFQQLSGPVMAKGLEDTVFYAFNRLVSLNEVGWTPDRFGGPVEFFHSQNLERLKSWPHSLITSSTHDSKRSEDVRARIDVLSEIPRQWRECLARWSRRNRKKKKSVDGRLAPDRNLEYLYYQTLVGAWPAGSAGEGELDLFKSRIKDYMLKAAREAKDYTSWISPDESYEQALLDFVDSTLSDRRFLGDLRDFENTVSRFGMINSLAQTLLKIASPGVPDFYQGCEVWDYSLVDPDNRRPIDYAFRMKILAFLKEREAEIGPARLARELAADMEDGAAKLFVITKALNYRKDNRAVFESGEYIPLEAAGSRSDHVCAFARLWGGTTIIAVVPRLLARFVRPGEPPLGADIWEDSLLEIARATDGARFRNILTGGEVAVLEQGGNRGFLLAEVFADFPVALLERLPG